MARRRDDRQDAIRSVVRRAKVRTQDELATRLQLMGYPCGSGTIARDIDEVGLRKVGDGFYVLGEDVELQRMVAEFVTGCEVAGNLAVIRTRGSVERGVAVAVDSACLPDVMCAAMGIGAVLVACRSEDGARRVADLVDVLR